MKGAARQPQWHHNKFTKQMAQEDLEDVLEVNLPASERRACKWRVGESQAC